ncbi:recombinase RecT, partial [Escherichia coli]
INVAAIGITLNPASKLAYLVPRDGMVCLDISYMGLLHIAMESGVISWGQAKLVHANDTYESNGLDKAPTHKYNAFGDRGDIVGVYCTV